MKEAAQQDVNISYHDIHHYAISYVLLAVAVAAFLWVMWRRGRPAVCLSAPAQPINSVSVSASAGHLPRPEPEQSVSAREQPLPEHGEDGYMTKRWSSLRNWRPKKDSSTSPINKRQSVFTIDSD